MTRIKKHESLNDDDDVILHAAHSPIQLEKNILKLHMYTKKRVSTRRSP